MTKQAELLAYLLEGLPQPPDYAGRLFSALSGWMVASPRFTVFVDTNRVKIRKKIRVTRDSEGTTHPAGFLEQTGTDAARCS